MSRTVMLVEDELLIAAMLEEMVIEAGYEPVGPFNTAKLALEYLEAHKPSVAILDYQLVDGTCAEIARRRAEREIGCIVISGYPKSMAVLGNCPHGDWLEKPFSQDCFVEALTRHSQPVDEASDQ